MDAQQDALVLRHRPDVDGPQVLPTEQERLHSDERKTHVQDHCNLQKLRPEASATLILIIKLIVINQARRINIVNGVRQRNVIMSFLTIIVVPNMGLEPSCLA